MMKANEIGDYTRGFLLHSVVLSDALVEKISVRANETRPCFLLFDVVLHKILDV
jgi:hypothetical protein